MQVSVPRLKPHVYANEFPHFSSGIEVVRQLRSIGRQDFIVGVTGNALKEDQEEYYDAGVDQYVLSVTTLEFC